MKKTLATKEYLEELGFNPYYRFWIFESKDFVGSITYTEEITPNFEHGENSLDTERYYCIKLHNRKKQEIRFFTETLYVEDIMSMFEMLKSN
jgi:hypothetical protein